MSIHVEEDKNGFFQVRVDGAWKIYGTTKEQAYWFLKGLFVTAEECGRKIKINDEYYELFP